MIRLAILLDYNSSATQDTDMYNFPIINHISDVLPYIEDAPEFIVVEKEGYTVINYVVAGHDTFPDIGSPVKDENGIISFLSSFENMVRAIVRRECRGLIFDKNGNIINRRFHKFFNIQEREETQIEHIDLSNAHLILEKLDGSMVSPFFIEGNLRWATKMGITDTSMQVEVFVASRPNYTYLAEELLGDDLCPIFEWCSNKNRIVLDYPEDQLILTAIRHNKTGEYDSYDTMLRVGKIYNVPVVKAYDVSSTKNINEIVEMVRKSEDSEGIVIRFDNGHMVKCKSEWYVNHHKVKSLLGQEKDVVKLILGGGIDDLLPVLPQEDTRKIEKFSTDLDLSISDCAYAIKHKVRNYCTMFDRKTFALEHAYKYNPLVRGLIFQFWDKEVDEHLTYQAIVDIITKNCGSNASYAKVKEAFLKDVNYV